jgi:hypothetical protein
VPLLEDGSSSARSFRAQPRHLGRHHHHEHKHDSERCTDRDAGTAGAHATHQGRIGWHFADAGNALMNICNRIAPEDVATTSQLVGDWYYMGHQQASTR